MNSSVCAIGIDVSKSSLDVCFATDLSSLQDTTVKKYSNSKDGIASLILALQQLSFSQNSPIVIESTGDYHILLATMLCENNYNVKLVNPLVLKQYSRSSIRKQKSDKIDARLLARVALLEPNITKTPSFDRRLVLARKKVSLINRLKKDRQAMHQRVEALSSLYNQLEVTIDPSYIGLQQALNLLTTSIKMLEKEVTQLMEGTWEVESLVKIQGISRSSASQICAVLQGRDFENKKQLTAYVGMDISTKKSGVSINKSGRLSKRGNPAIRRILFNVAWGLCRFNQEFQAMYDQLKEKGKHHFECLVIIARKFLHMVFGMWKTRTEFNIAML